MRRRIHTHDILVEAQEVIHEPVGLLLRDVTLSTIREIPRRLLEALCIIEGVAREQQRLVVLEVEEPSFLTLHPVSFVPSLELILR